MTYLVKQRSGVGAWYDADPEDLNPVPTIEMIVDNVKAAVTAVPAESVPASEGNLNVSAAGTASISAADFNSSCKPNNFLALTYVQNLQKQLNRVAAVKGFPLIAPDGQIGTKGLALFKKVQAAFPSIMGDTSKCLYISADADVLGDQVKDVADSLGAPAVVAAPARQATIVTKAGTTVLPPGAPPASIVGAFSGVTMGQGLALAGIAGGIGYFLLKKKRRKGRR